MRIASNGMVLVGGTTNTNGGSLLKVGGSGHDGEITLNSDTTASYIVSYDRTAGAYHPIISTASEHQLNGGNVGIGTSSPGDANEGAGLRVHKYVDRDQYYSPAGSYAGSFGYTNNTNTKTWL